jgi:hypothetical protein
VKTTWYFENVVLKRRPYLKREWCERVRANPDGTLVQKNGRVSHWGYVPELAEAIRSEKYLRVITESDGETIHNAYPDRDYNP